MSDIALSVEHLSKRYNLGQLHAGSDGLRHILQEKLTSPFRRFRKGRARTPVPGQDGEFWALDDVNFEVSRGEVVGVVGRNGAGKSTLLKILSRITEPSRGRVTIVGRVASLLEVGTGFHAELTGRENIFLNGAILGMARTEIARKFDEIVAFAEVERFLDTPVKRYSSGMYVRLAFAVAAHLEPEILIIDEVLAVGDAQFQDKCLGKMKQVASSGRTVFFVSHNVNTVERLCSAAMLLESGRMVEFGPEVHRIVQRYMRNSKNEGQQSSWQNAGDEFTNPWFKPLAFRLVEDDGTPVTQAKSNNAEFFVEIEAEVGKVDPALTVGYRIFDESGTLLYWSFQTDTAPATWPILREGKCILRSQFPPRLVNEGTYRLELIGGLHYREWLLEPGKDVPTISLTIQGGLSETPLWVERRPGLIAPALPWSARAAV